VNANALVYATRIDAVTWAFEGSKFSCQISHVIDDFGRAVFERPAGLSPRFVLVSQSPRMKSGKADLLSQPPSWLPNESPEKLALVSVKQGEKPINLTRKMSERMLAELQKGMDLHVVRQPWYGDKKSLTVVIPSVGFRQTYSDYLGCLSGLLPVNFSQVERNSLRYDNGDEDLTNKTKRYLDKVAIYIKEDVSVKSIYIDGHTDSAGIRNENLLKSQLRAERVVDYLVSKGVSRALLVVRWHGERYQIATNQTKAGKAKNRRVTIRLSKEAPPVIKKPDEQSSAEMQAKKETMLAENPKNTEKSP
jgi:outer membrane protein OmpA-like peptidoglycan-associated protein